MPAGDWPTKIAETKPPEHRPGSFAGEAAKEVVLKLGVIRPMLAIPVACYRDSRLLSSIRIRREVGAAPHAQSTRLRSSPVAPGAKLLTRRPS
jgi:hypothetical protein